MRFFSLLAVLLVSGCSWLQPPTVSAPADEAAEPIAVVVPNPYLLTRTDVPEPARELFQRASRALAEARWEQAEQDLLALTRAFPGFSGPWLNLGQLYVRQGRDAEAEQAWRQALSVNPANDRAYNQLAILLRQSGRFEEAAATWRQALAIWPDNPVAHRNLGILCDLYLGDWAQALWHYQRYQALQAEPERQVAGWIVDLQRRMQQEEMP